MSKIVSSEILIIVPETVKHLTGEPLKGIVKFRLIKDEVYKNVTVTLVEKTCTKYIYDNKNIADYCTIPIEPDNLSNYQTRKVVKVSLLNETTEEGTLLEAGPYEYPFEMLIPEDTPPSTKTSHKGVTLGGIRYFLILKFKKPEFFSTGQYFITKLTIYPKIDSTVSDKPVIASLGKILTKLFDPKKKKYEIEVKVELDKEYLTPTCERKISFNVKNNSDTMFTIQTELICVTKTNLPFSKSKETTEVLATVETPKIPDNSISNMFNIIPVAGDQRFGNHRATNDMFYAIPMGVYTVRYSKQISREFKYRVTLKLPAPHSNVFAEIPVFVGEKV